MTTTRPRPRHHDHSSYYPPTARPTRNLQIGSSTGTAPLLLSPLLIVAYVAFGVLHELAHFIVALWLSSSSSPITTTTSATSSISASQNSINNSSSLLLLFVGNVARAIMGRYSLVPVGIVGVGGDGVLLGQDDENYDYSHADDDIILHRRIRIILHAGWIYSVLLAVSCHLLHCYARKTKRKWSQHQHQRRPVPLQLEGCDILLFLQEKVIDIFYSPILPIAAYITALEAVSTDLLGFVPASDYSSLSSSSQKYSHLLLHQYHHHDDGGGGGNYHHRVLLLRCFCGNFGILLLNPSWLAIDGGRTALDILEKMINVTMMRGKYYSNTGVSCCWYYDGALSQVCELVNLFEIYYRSPLVIIIVSQVHNLVEWSPLNQININHRHRHHHSLLSHRHHHHHHHPAFMAYARVLSMPNAPIYPRVCVARW